MTAAHPIRIHYNERGVPYSVTTQRRIPPAHVVMYAHSKNVSWNGCWTTADVDYRSQMLKSITRAHDNGWLIR